MSFSTTQYDPPPSEAMRDAVITAAWEAWTKNGLGLDDDDVKQTIKSVADAVNNAWEPGMSDSAWLAATLARLDGAT